MELQKNRIAIVSPSQKVYSETFIQAQKNGLRGEVFYYYGGALPLYLENYGVLLSKKKYYWYKLKKKLGYTNFNAQELAFIESLKKSKIQVVLAQYGTTAHRIVKICSYLKLPLVTHFHGYDASINQVISRCGFYKDVFAYSTKVIVVSEKMELKLLELGCPRDKLVYNVYGPQEEFEKVKPTFNKKQFIAIGRFTDKKAPYYTIMAFKNVLKKHPDAILIMAGDGLLLNTCKNLVRQYNILDQVVFTGVIKPEVYRGYLSQSLAFVQHSITAENGDMEGTPVAVLEASAASLPVISTYHAGIPDVIIHDKTGLLCEEHDVETMSKYMLQLLNDVSYAKALGSTGRIRMQKHYSIKLHLSKLEDILSSVIS